MRTGGTSVKPRHAMTPADHDRYTQLRLHSGTYRKLAPMQVFDQLRFMRKEYVQAMPPCLVAVRRPCVHYRLGDYATLYWARVDVNRAFQYVDVNVVRSDVRANVWHAKSSTPNLLAPTTGPTDSTALRLLHAPMCSSALAAKVAAVVRQQDRFWARGPSNAFDAKLATALTFERARRKAHVRQALQESGVPLGVIELIISFD